MENGTVHIEANKGMYGLPQAGLLANELLEKRLNKRGYFQSKLVPGLWKHKRRPVPFTLVVDDFGVKYVGKEHAQYLRDTLKENYNVTTDWSGKRSLDWDYKRRQVYLSMPKYVKKSLKQFRHMLKKRQYQPFPKCKDQLRRKEAVRQAEAKCTFVGQRTEIIHTESVWKISFSWKSSRQYSAVPHKCNYIAISSANRGHNGSDTAVVGQHSNAKGAVLTHDASYMIFKS